MAGRDEQGARVMGSCYREGLAKRREVSLDDEMIGRSADAIPLLEREHEASARPVPNLEHYAEVVLRAALADRLPH